MMVNWIPLLLLETTTFILGHFFLNEIQWQFMQRLVLTGFWLYLMFLFFLCFRPSFGNPFVIFRSFHNVPINIWPTLNLRIDTLENIILTVPTGAFFALIFQRINLLEAGLLSIIPGILIESGQFVADYFCQIERIVDINDIISNWLGCMLGFFVISSIIRINPKLWQRFAFN
ncbi:VanZ family protein [Lactobacillus alvi]|uniref:VanZ family protein n=1 Tax=Limosilactobacillus alvi TaxID=990412 RepID=A0ABS2EPN2_9LACO|nr:VanZ family protein [Limosilactobacillus alvi]MBM6754345.1 VanZ family protein [Limosilactobacillus alvi]